MTTASLNFRPKARIIRTIGDKLISGPEAAVIELVKNAHDADAKSVTITFKPAAPGQTDCIIITDDGHGMSMQDIRTKWMEPATADKATRRTSPGGRQLLGSKGIGRFAGAKLGRFLDLETSVGASTGQVDTVSVKGVDWEAFDGDHYLDEISFPFEVVTGAGCPGTTLTIRGLRDAWTRERQQTLFGELRRLICPVEKSDDLDFQIFMKGTEVTEDAEPIRPFPVLRACDYEVEGAFDEDGRFTGTMTVRRGEQPPQPIDQRFPLRPEAGENPCGMVLVHLFIFDREASAVQDATRRAGFGDTGVREARRILDSVAGVAIYRDRFRVRPYGDSTQDWLTLDTRRVQQPAQKIGHNQVAGILQIDSEASSGLVERSSREGFEENGSFLRLQHMVLELFAREIEPRRLKFREDAGIDRRPPDSLDGLRKAVDLNWAQALVNRLPKAEQEAAQKIVTEKAVGLQDLLAGIQKRQAILEERATLGLIIAEVLHEGRNPTSFIATEVGRLARWLPDICADDEVATQRRVEIPEILRGLGNSANRLSTLFRMLQPLASGSRGRPSAINCEQVIGDTVRLFRQQLNDAKIEVSLSIEAGASAQGYRQDLATAIANLVDNSIHWLASAKKTNAKIEISARRSGDEILVSVIDNGPGVRSEFVSRVFDVGFTLKVDGMGLGLSIAREALARSGGRIALVESDGGTRFDLTLRTTV